MFPIFIQLPLIKNGILRSKYKSIPTLTFQRCYLENSHNNQLLSPEDMIDHINLKFFMQMLACAEHEARPRMTQLDTPQQKRSQDQTGRL
jgi:hypothetical protein